MNGVTQTILHDPERPGVPGNCLQAAVATLLGLPLDAVPHFATFSWWTQAMHLWAGGLDLRLQWVRASRIPHERCIVGGRSSRGVRHVCVAEHGRIAWDPHPSREGLVTITEAFRFLPSTKGVPLLFGGYDAAERLRAMGYRVERP